MLICNKLEEIQNDQNVIEAVRKSFLPQEYQQHFSHFLSVLLQSAETNSNRADHGKRYSSKLKLFASYLFLYGGRSLYKILSTNLKNSLPSLKTVNRTVSSQFDYKEDELRVEELSIYLRLKKYNTNIWIQEDQTRINGRIQYWIKTDQLVGFVLPLNSNGLPKKNCFLASTASDIKNIFSKNDISTYVNVIVAQPMQENAIPFCIASYGTNNKFSAENVMHRWDFIKNSCESYGIIVQGFSGDADSRILRTMNTKTFTLQKNIHLPWFFVSTYTLFSFYINLK